MNIHDLKTLAKVIDLCRKKGVETIKIDDIELTFNSSVLETANNKTKQRLLKADDTQTELRAPTIDELIDWSSAGPVEPQPEVGN